MTVHPEVIQNAVLSGLATTTRNRETVQETTLSTSDSPVCTSPAFRVSSWGDELK